MVNAIGFFSEEIGMGRRIFEERNFNINKKVLSFDEFKLFADLEQGFSINEEQKPRLIKRAEEMLDREIPQLYAHEYMMFSRNGNRSEFQSRFFPRRTMLLTLALGEYVERQGRFTDKLIDVLWLMLEETTWVIPAHNQTKEGIKCCLPYAYSGDVDYIDLFSATTAAAISCVYYLCRDILDDVTTIITDRMLSELDRRIIKPFMNDTYLWERCWWSGIKGNVVNNWCPWIVSNVLTVTAFTVKNNATRAAILKRSMEMLDCFTSIYHPDGGCDEGPSYWGAAGGALFNACLVLSDMTGGYVNVFDDPLIKNMGEYAVKVKVTNERSLNFADSPSKADPSPIMIYHWGVLSGSDMMKNYGAYKLGGELSTAVPDIGMPYRWMRFITTNRLPKEDFTAPDKFYIGGIEVAGIREGNKLGEGLYVAMKGGNNNESHNHNDLGNIVVFNGNTPIFIDAGSGEYTKRTFSSERYTIWAMRSEYHNCATFNGVTQNKGADAYSSDTVYDKDSGKMTLNLKTAYPSEAGLERYIRTIELENSGVKITDDIEFIEAGDVYFSYIVRAVPEMLNDNSFTIDGNKVTFDPSLEYAIEELDATWPEVAKIPKGWDAEVLYRITLTAKEKIDKKTYVLTVSK